MAKLPARDLQPLCSIKFNISDSMRQEGKLVFLKISEHIFLRIFEHMYVKNRGPDASVKGGHVYFNLHMDQFASDCKAV